MIRLNAIKLCLLLALASANIAFANIQNQRLILPDTQNVESTPQTTPVDLKAYESELYANATEELSQFGDADVQFVLGALYISDKITSPDYSKAAELFSLAASQGHIGAQSNLGLLYLTGAGLKQNKTLAKDWFTKAAKGGDDKAKYCLDTEFKDGSQQTQLTIDSDWVKQAFAQKNAEAFNRLSGLYWNGFWVKQDLSKSLYWLHEAAELGSTEAQNKLGLLYQYGDYVTKDSLKAVEWYKKSANQNDAMGQYYLANMYHDGEGVDKDLYEAAEWFKKSAAQGFAEAQFNLGNFYKRETVNPDYKEAIRWYEKAANQGHSAAQNNLGLMYDNGLGCKKNYNTAKNFYIQAANQGELSAINNLAILFGNGTGVKKNLIVEYALYVIAAKETLEASHNILIVADKLSQKQIDKAEALAKQLEIKGNFKKALNAYLKQSKN